MNKQLSLLRAHQSNTNKSVPLESVANLLEPVANVFPSTSTSTNAAMEESSKSKKKKYITTGSLILSMPIKIRPDKKIKNWQ